MTTGSGRLVYLKSGWLKFIRCVNLLFSLLQQNHCEYKESYITGKNYALRRKMYF